MKKCNAKMRVQTAASAEVMGWSEAPSYQPPNDGGDVEFTLSPDGSSFAGKWRHGSSGDWNTDWNGTRK